MEAAPNWTSSDRDLSEIIREMESVKLPKRALDRRGFIKLSGGAAGGLILAFNMGGFVRPAKAAADAAKGNVAVLNAYVRIAPSGEITLVNKAPEIGQGIKTSFPMILAEHLDADWNDVRVEQAPINPDVYGRQSAGGSRSTPTGWEPLRRAGSVARAMLVSAAAKDWGVPASECTTEASAVVHGPSKRRAKYADLAMKAAKLPVPDEKTVKIKEKKDWKLLGTRVMGVDVPKIVTGQPLYGIDQVQPGMLYATYTKAPATGGKPTNANLDEIKKMPGVKDAFFVDGNGKVNELMPGVAIVANSTWAAIKAKRALKVDWDESEASKDSWTGAQVKAKQLAGKAPEKVLKEKGDVDAAFKSGAKVLDAFYTYPYLSHAPMEPQNCTAHWKDGEIEIWAPTQAADRALDIMSGLLKIEKSKVVIHQTRAGGGFGRRLSNDYMCEVAAITKQVGVPVKLQWTREDDMAHDFYRPGGFHQVKGAVDQKGKLVAWHDHLITFTADGKAPTASGDVEIEMFPTSTLTNARVSQSMIPGLTPTGPWRAPRSNAIAWVVQSFLHELSSAAGRDHVEFLIETMGEPRWLEPKNDGAMNTGRAVAVIKLAAEKAGWGKPLPKGRALGAAFFFSHSGHFAEVAEVSVDATRKVTVHKVTVAGDCGPIMNASGAETQVQGAVIDGLSTMLGLEVTFENGRNQQTNFNQYPILRMAHAPEVEAHFIEADYPPTGLGEPALPPLAPAVCNAIFTATGHRIRQLPLMREEFTV
ncbi:MAG TPA: molybdopterin cofactor-binding domain-containing protein [Micropepsaceae bacterium]|nr:molybdopterin cofactor-binding domain-containing protein [Micropepsaceae bacterium]